MKKLVYTAIFAAAVLFAPTASAEVTVSGGADLVSSYVWRGAYQTGSALQPTATVAAGNFSIGAWASSPIGQTGGAKEIDFFASYAVGGFSASITDYWWTGEGYEFFNGQVIDGAYKRGHYWELSLAYALQGDFPLSVAVSTMFAGDGDEKADGDQQYSTYVTLSYPFTVSTVDCSLSVGLTPFDSVVYATDKFDVCQVSLRASKTIFESDGFSIPVFVDTILSPAYNNAFVVGGLGVRF